MLLGRKSPAKFFSDSQFIPEMRRAAFRSFVGVIFFSANAGRCACMTSRSEAGCPVCENHVTA